MRSSRNPFGPEPGRVGFWLLCVTAIAAFILGHALGLGTPVVSHIPYIPENVQVVCDIQYNWPEHGVDTLYCFDRTGREFTIISGRGGST